MIAPSLIALYASVLRWALTTHDVRYTTLTVRDARRAHLARLDAAMGSAR